MTPSTDIQDPRQALAELEERVRDGDSTVSAATLAKARQAAELADLHDQASKRREERGAAERRQAEVKALRFEVDKARMDQANIAEAYTSMVNALRVFGEQIEAWKAKRAALVVQARPLGLDVEAEGLPALDRDWFALAAAEARGRYLRTHKLRRVGRTSVPRIAFHELHGPQARQRIEAEEVERDALRLQHQTESEEDEL